MESKGPCKLYCTGLFMLIVDSLLLSVRWSMSLKLNHIKNLCSSYSLVFVFSFCVNVFNFFFLSDFVKASGFGFGCVLCICRFIMFDWFQTISFYNK